MTTYLKAGAVRRLSPRRDGYPSHGPEQPARAQGVARGVSPERLPVLPEARESAARAVRISGAAGKAATEVGDASVGRQCPVAPPCRQLITNVGVVM